MNASAKYLSQTHKSKGPFCKTSNLSNMIETVRECE